MPGRAASTPGTAWAESSWAGVHHLELVPVSPPINYQLAMETDVVSYALG